jgi:hypothetical protein
MKMRSTYILEHKTVDKLGRFKKSVHIGAFKTLEDVELAKSMVLAKTPTATFEIYISDHILFE